MTETPDDEIALALTLARERVAEMTKMFDGMKDLLTALLDKYDAPDKTTTKALLAKINDLQTAHFMVVRAEEAFHEKFGDGPAEAELDVEAARRDIAGSLDRIRASIGPEDLCGGTGDA